MHPLIVRARLTCRGDVCNLRWESVIHGNMITVKTSKTGDKARFTPPLRPCWILPIAKGLSGSSFKMMLMMNPDGLTAVQKSCGIFHARRPTAAELTPTRRGIEGPAHP